MKQYVAILLFIFSGVTSANAQFGNPPAAATFNGKYIKSAGYLPTAPVKRFSLFIPSSTQNQSSLYGTLSVQNKIFLHEKNKLPAWQSAANLAGQLLLSVIANRNGLYYISPTQQYRSIESYNR